MNAKIAFTCVVFRSSSETQGQVVGRGKVGTGENKSVRRRVKGKRKSPWGQGLSMADKRPSCTIPCQSTQNGLRLKRLKSFSVRARPFGTGPVRRCPQGLFRLPSGLFLRSLLFFALSEFPSSHYLPLDLRGCI